MSSLCFEYFLYLWQNRVVHARLLLSLPSSEIGDSFKDPGSLYWKIVCGSGNVLVTSRVLLLPDHLSGRCVHTHTRARVHSTRESMYSNLHPSLFLHPSPSSENHTFHHLHFQSNTTGFILVFSHSALVALFANREKFGFCCLDDS